MSDALTDINRDKEISRVLKKIQFLEDLFRENPAPMLARILVDFWDQYRFMRNGYWQMVNRELAAARVRELESYILGQSEPTPLDVVLIIYNPSYPDF